MAKKVTNWRIIVSGDEYSAPEITRFHLQGEATWVPDYEPNKLTTSPIVGSEKDGRVLVTRSGSRYELGKPESSAVRSFKEMREAFPHTPLN